MNKINDISLKQFLSFFPIVSPPVVISKDTITTFSKENKPLPMIALEKYFKAWGDEIDEFVEFVPCFSLEATQEYQTLVYWKASLLSYEYIIVTLDKTSEVISKKVIAGIISDGIKSVQSAATIQEDLTIHIASGMIADNNLYDAKDSKQTYMEIMPSGQIITINEENYVNDKKEQEQ